MGISGGEAIVLLILAFLLIGPERLPAVAQQLGRLTRELKALATGAKERVREELGPEFDDLAAFDPRQYDPRRIVREALQDDTPAHPAARPPAARRRPPAGATAAAGAVGVAAVAQPAVATPAPAPVEGAPAPATPSPAASTATPAVAAATPAVAPATPVVAAPTRSAAVAPAAPAAGGPDGATPAGAAAPDVYVVPFDDEAT
ncbi:twin-arginine translocase TatA/TatE family subunit [Georgenia sp. SYP-B2076]|uniref:twin-arginine translocase TatA/TatE family subunit n=1 Tax=Georgenia sp. SYP-B2076 TaxID=2495881 RepID=UPI001F0CC3D8|nr:twin-arginine translocase TatA/TatE family subunit [Georgenia sp. SYP-B2076]